MFRDPFYLLCSSKIRSKRIRYRDDDVCKDKINFIPFYYRWVCSNKETDPISKIVFIGKERDIGFLFKNVEI